MEKIGFVADSTCELMGEGFENRDLHIVPIHIHVGEEYFLDGVDIDAPKFIGWVKENKYPRTAACSPDEFREAYKKVFEAGYDKIISTHVSSKVSSCYQAALAASKTFQEGKVFVIDTMTAMAGHVAYLSEAMHLRDQGHSAEEIFRRFQESRKISGNFAGCCVRDLDYLVRCGRLGKGRAFLGNLLRLTPMLRGEEGVFVVWTKARGMKAVYKEMTEQFRRDGAKVKRVYITYGIHSEDQKDELVKKFKDEFSDIQCFSYPSKVATLSTMGLDFLVYSYFKEPL